MSRLEIVPYVPRGPVSLSSLNSIGNLDPYTIVSAIVNNPTVRRYVSGLLKEASNYVFETGANLANSIYESAKKYLTPSENKQLSKYSQPSLATTIEVKNLGKAILGVQNLPSVRILPYSPSHPLKRAILLNSIETMSTKKKNQPKKKNAMALSPLVTTVSQPVSKSKLIKNTPPRYSSMPNGNIMVTHREYLGDFVGAGAGTFAVQKIYPLDPAEGSTFPWLAALGPLYEQFKFQRLKIDYVCEAPTSTAGAVIMAYDANGGRAVPRNKVSLMEINDCLRGPAWQSMTMNCTIDTTKKYVAVYNDFGQITGFLSANPLGQAANTTQNTTAGVVYVGTSNVATTVTGEIWLEYTVELIGPTLALPPPTILRCMVGVTSDPTSIFGTYPQQSVNANLFQLFGNTSITSAGTATLNFTALGNCLFTYVIPTSGASASGVWTITSPNSPGFVSTIVGFAISTSAVCGAYVLTGVTPGAVVSAFHSGGWTNLSFSAANPARIYVTPFDGSATNTIVL